MRNKKTTKILKQAGENQTEGIILVFIFSEFLRECFGEEAQLVPGAVVSRVLQFAVQVPYLSFLTTPCPLYLSSE